MNSVGAETKPTKQLRIYLSTPNWVVVSLFALTGGTYQSDFLSKHH